MDTTLKKGMINVLVANIINLLFSLITSFILPKYLSVDSYSIVKTFQLYISYVGLMHLGYVDGMYLKYGGKKFEEIDKSDLKTDLSTIRIFQLCIAILWVGFGIYIKDYLIIIFALAILPQNMNSYFRYLFQSIGEFKKYSKILNLTTIGTFIANALLIFVIKTQMSWTYCIAYTIIYLIIWICLELEFHKYLDKNIEYCKFSIFHLVENIKSGMLLMLGTFSSILLTSIDRWFVKFTMDTVAFAKYSFAVSIDHFVNVAFTPISTTLYNYFCRKRNECNFEKMRINITIFSTFIVAAAFPAKFILEQYLTDYLDTVKVLFFLFSSQIFFIIVKSVYVNLYKVNKMQKKYFIKLISVIFAGCILNILCFKIYPCKEAYALGTLLSAIYWYAISIPDFKFLNVKLTDILYSILEMVVFLICGFYLNSILGACCYIVFSIILTYCLYKKYFYEIINIAIGFIKSKIKI